MGEGESGEAKVERERRRGGGERGALKAKACCPTSSEEKTEVTALERVEGDMVKSIIHVAFSRGCINNTMTPCKFSSRFNGDNRNERARHPNIF